MVARFYLNRTQRVQYGCRATLIVSKAVVQSGRFGGAARCILNKTRRSKMKIPVQRLHLKRRVGIRVVALLAGAAFLAGLAAPQSPVGKPSQSEMAARARERES